MIALLFSSIATAIANAASAGEDVWRPSPNFSVEGASYIETLTFISGIAYALSYSGHQLTKSGLKNFYCLPENDEVSSRLIIDIVNEHLTGDRSSEEITSVVITGLGDKYPCDK